MSVHPRVCGELWTIYSVHLNGHGSSPRVWGTQLHGHGIRIYRRFIPACVGNSVLSLSQVATVSVHPRVCGELHWNHALTE